MRRVKMRRFGITAALLLPACGQTAPDETVQHEAQPLTAPTQVNTFALLASGHVTVGDRTTLTGGNVGVAPGTGDSVTYGSDTHVAIVNSTLGQRVVLKDRAATGNLFATTVVQGTGVTYSSLSPYVAPPAQPVIPAFTAGTTALTVNTPTTLAAGNFGQVTLNSTLTLTGGTYQFQNLTFGTNAILQASAAAVVRVAGKVAGATSNFVHIGPTGTQPAANFRLIVAGATDTNGGITLGTDARVTALVVSRASVTVGDRFTGKGSIAASNFTAGNDAVLTFQTGFDCSANSGCDDGNACTTDSCVDAKCIHTTVPNGTACPDDGNACTSDACSSGVCAHSALANGTACSDDGNACTSDTCASGTCIHPSVADGSSCPDDGDPCTTDACASGACAHTEDPSLCPVLPPITPRPLPKAPAEIGCYWYTLNGWEAIPCEPVQDVIARNGVVPAVPPALSSPYTAETPNPTTAMYPVLVPSGSPPTPLVFAQAEMMFPAITSEEDNVPNPPVPSKGCEQSETPLPNAFSVQLNTNKFLMANGDDAAIQFAVLTQGLGQQMDICAWQVDVTTQNYDSTSVCVPTPPKRRSTPLQPFDYVNVAGSVDPTQGTMSIVMELSWVEPGMPNIYAQTGVDRYGLGNHWVEADAAILGFGDCSQAQFTNTSLVTRMMASTCPGVTTPTSSTIGCPTATFQPNAKFENRTATAETNNLIQLGTPTVSYPNPYLALTNLTATTSGQCIDPKHVYVRDYDLDNGSEPSNPAGQAFWESPDIFLVPKGAPVDKNSEPSQSLITPDTDFDVYVRVHNDLGCAPVTGVKALAYIADPQALSTPWNPLTNGQYTAQTAAGVTVGAGDQALIGPFSYHSPATGFGDGHKCLIAAIIADGEPAASDAFDAPDSNQVAQRNLQFENCAYPLTNASGTDGLVEIALHVTPAETAPSLTTTPDIEVSFDDGDSSWFNIWTAQSGNGTAYKVTRNGSQTVVRLGQSSITLQSVPLSNGSSRTALASLTLPTGAPVTTLALQATLVNAATGAQLAPSNGGSCALQGIILN
jgi:hypothetical protein